MHQRSHRFFSLWIAFIGLGLGAQNLAADQDTATITITGTGTGPTIEVKLIGPAASMVGFTRAPATAEERQTLELATENLKTGDALVRFNVQAGCHLEASKIDSDPSAKGEDPADLGATYDFHCDRPELLDSAALGLFMGFPVLARVHVHYTLPRAKGEAVLTPGTPVVSFVPLQ